MLTQVTWLIQNEFGAHQMHTRICEPHMRSILKMILIEEVDFKLKIQSIDLLPKPY